LSTEIFVPKFPGKSKPQNISEKYPLKASKLDQGLKLSMAANKSIYFQDICNSPSLLVHSPYEVPGSFEKEEKFNIDFGFDFQVLITPEIITTDDSLKSLDPKKRGCYFKGEKKLKFFKVYTRRNCEFECYSEMMGRNKRLNCTQYFMIRDESSEVCDYRQEGPSQEESFFALRNKGKCNCLDACNSIKYKVEILSNYLVDKEASIEVRFKDVDVFPLRRYQPFTFSDFLAQSGGLMGLFAAISVLSVIEVVYFLSLRLMVNLWRKCKSG
jgi:acid-sensing ion channel, other